VSTSTSVGLSTSNAQGLYVPQASEAKLSVIRSIQGLARGQTNTKGTFTLSSTGATLVTVSNVNCTPQSIPSWTPVTADGAAQMATLFVLSSNVTTGQFIVSQATNTSTSSIFNYALHS
jgi:hypothetical protein